MCRVYFGEEGKMSWRWFVPVMPRFGHVEDICGYCVKYCEAFSVFFHVILLFPGNSCCFYEQIASSSNKTTHNKHTTYASPIYTPKNPLPPPPASHHQQKTPYHTHGSCSDDSAPTAASTTHHRTAYPLAHPQSTPIYPVPPWPATTRIPRETARCG